MTDVIEKINSLPDNRALRVEGEGYMSLTTDDLKDLATALAVAVDAMTKVVKTGHADGKLCPFIDDHLREAIARIKELTKGESTDE